MLVSKNATMTKAYFLLPEGWQPGAERARETNGFRPPSSVNRRVYEGQ